MKHPTGQTRIYKVTAEQGILLRDIYGFMWGNPNYKFYRSLVFDVFTSKQYNEFQQTALNEARSIYLNKHND